MQGMRSLMQGSLGRSLRSLSDLDRLAAALPVVCGSALAAHCEVTGFDERRVVRIEVSGTQWLNPLLGMRDVLERDLRRTAAVDVAALELGLRSSEPRRRSPVPPNPNRTTRNEGMANKGDRQ